MQFKALRTQNQETENYLFVINSRELNHFFVKKTPRGYVPLKWCSRQEYLYILHKAGGYNFKKMTETQKREAQNIKVGYYHKPTWQELGVTPSGYIYDNARYFKSFEDLEENMYYPFSSERPYPLSGIIDYQEEKNGRWIAYYGNLLVNRRLKNYFSEVYGIEQITGDYTSESGSFSELGKILLSDDKFDWDGELPELYIRSQGRTFSFSLNDKVICKVPLGTREFPAHEYITQGLNNEFPEVIGVKFMISRQLPITDKKPIAPKMQWSRKKTVVIKCQERKDRIFNPVPLPEKYLERVCIASGAEKTIQPLERVITLELPAVPGLPDEIIIGKDINPEVLVGAIRLAMGSSDHRNTYVRTEVDYDVLEGIVMNHYA